MVTTPERMPRERVAAAVGAWGEPVVVGWCVRLLSGAGPGAVPHEAAVVLGGRHALGLLQRPDPTQDHWWRVWGARGLLYAWDGSASDQVWAALDDEAWRVREGALRVVARHRLDEDPRRLVELADDPVARVRSAAARASVRSAQRTL